MPRTASKPPSQPLHCFDLANTRLLAAALALSPTSLLMAAEPDVPVEALAELSLEELSNVRVTTVSRTEEDLADAAAAVAVVTDEDIRRSGATNVPEAVRMVPGIHVAQAGANIWAVSSRGFASSNSPNLLVLSDSRSIYTPLFSGVIWSIQDYLLEDIDRIEVIRGPGATLWGANAVNGVMNIITKSAKETHGTYAQTVVGTEEQSAALRYGDQLANGIHYRAFVQHSERDDSYAPANPNSDQSELSHLGFRADWEASPEDAFTVQGDFYQGAIGQLKPSVQVLGRQGPEQGLEADVYGGNVLGRWKHRIDQDSDFQLRAYYDRTYVDDPTFEDTLNTFDIEFQHHLGLGWRHDLLWGLNYRFSSNRNEGKGIFDVTPDTSRDQLVSLFVQDQIVLAEPLRLMIGTKLEHNDFSGFELQPSARLTWDLAPGHTTWGAISRAVRVPTRYERDVDIDLVDPDNNQIPRLVGNDNFESENMVAYELGYRWQASHKLSFDLAAFHNRYEDLASVEFAEPFVDSQGRTIIPVVTENLSEGHTQGFEALIHYAPALNWQLTASYSFLDMDIDAHGEDLNRGEFLEGSTPKHQLAVRSSLDWRRYQFDIQLRHHSDIRSTPEIPTGEGISGYTEMDVRVARRFGESIELSLVGQNLLDSHHPEFGASESRGEIERSVYTKLAVTF